MKTELLLETLKNQYFNMAFCRKFFPPIFLVVFLYSLFVPGTLIVLIKLILYVFLIGLSIFFHIWISRKEDGLLKYSLVTVNLIIFYDVAKLYGGFFTLSSDLIYAFFPILKTPNMISSILDDVNALKAFLTHINASVTSVFLLNRLYKMFNEK